MGKRGDINCLIGSYMPILLKKWWDMLTKMRYRRELLLIVVHLPIFQERLLI